jgi:death on curing protein
VKEPRWVDRRAVVLLHSEGLAEHGGGEGIRDEALLDSALARPQNRFHYDGEADVARLAAAYGFGLVRNHPFVDGNKRLAFVVVGLFLGLNGYRLISDRVDEIQIVMGLAAGELSEDEFADWLRTHSERKT